jgi:hypothetical protein
LFVIPAHDDGVTLQDELVVARLRSKIAALRPHVVMPVDADFLDYEEQGFDFL